MAKSQAATDLVPANSSSTEVSLYDPDFETGPSGLENVTAGDVRVPRLSIIQALSPQLDPNKPEYIEGARVGDFVDPAMKETWRGTLHVLPVNFATFWLEWKPDRGGLVKNWGMDSVAALKGTTRDDKGRNVRPNGNFVAKTPTYFVLNLSAGGRPSFLPLASTNIRASEDWMTKITNEKVERPDGTFFTPHIFYRSWFAKPIQRSNAKGSWVAWTFEPGPTVIELDESKGLLGEAKRFLESVIKGETSGDMSDMEAEEVSHSEVPF